MRIANVKSMVAKGMLAAVAAGAWMIASPVKADAQQFGAGVYLGYPHRDFDRERDFERRREFLRRQEFLRHEEFLRMHRFDHRYWR